MLPLPSRSHPQKQNRAVYTKELTHLCESLCNQEWHLELVALLSFCSKVLENADMFIMSKSCRTASTKRLCRIEMSVHHVPIIK